MKKMVMMAAALLVMAAANANNINTLIGKKKPETTAVQSGQNTLGVQQQQLMNELNSDFNQWNFNALQEKDATALVTLKLNADGSVEVIRIKTENPQFSGIITENMSKLSLQACNCDASYLTVKLRYEIMP